MLREQVGAAVLEKADTLSDPWLRASDEDVIRAYDEAIAPVQSTTDAAELVFFARSLLGKGKFLAGKKRYEEAISAFGELVAQKDALPEQPALLADALIEKIGALRALERHEEALAACDLALSELSTLANLELGEKTVTALHHKGGILRDLHRWHEAIAVYDELLNRFGGSAEASLRETIGEAAFNKALSLREVDGHEKAIAIFDDLTHRYGGETQSSDRLCQLVADSLLYKGINLGDMKRSNDAIAVFERLQQFCRENRRSFAWMTGSDFLNWWLMKTFETAGERLQSLRAPAGSA